MMRKVTVYSPMWPTTMSPGFGSFVAAFYRQISADPMLETSVVHSTTDLNSSKLERLKDIIFSTLRFLTNAIHKEIWYVHYLPLTMPLIAVIARLSRKVIVLNLHGDEVTDGGLKRNFLRCSTRRLLQNYSKLYFIVPSSYFKELTARWFELKDTSSIFVSASGGIPDSWYHHRTNRDKLGSPERPLVVGYVGRLDPGKNWEMAFIVCQALNQQGIHAKVLICGWGPDMEKLPAQGKASSVLWELVSGVPRDDLPNIYKQIDLLVFWSTRAGESLGLVGLEALASGIPVIAYPDYGPATYINHKKNGYLLPAATPQELNGLAYWAKDCISRFEEASKFCMDSALAYRESQVARKLIAHLRSLPPHAQRIHPTSE